MADIYDLKKRVTGNLNNGPQPFEKFVASQRWREGPGTVIFYSPCVCPPGTEYPFSITARVTMPETNVYAVIELVRKNGGIWSDDGTYFIMWPMAFIEIHLDDPEEAAT